MKKKINLIFQYINWKMVAFIKDSGKMGNIIYDFWENETWLWKAILVIGIIL